MRISTIIRHCRAWRPSLRCTAATHLHDHTVELVRLLAHLFEEKHRAPVVGRIWRAAQRRQEAQVAAHRSAAPPQPPAARGAAAGPDQLAAMERRARLAGCGTLHRPPQRRRLLQRAAIEVEARGGHRRVHRHSAPCAQRVRPSRISCTAARRSQK